jgi:8-oxo-dGTP diphosphatase
MIVTVVAAIIRRPNQILITRRLDRAHLPGLWEFPGGKVERGESLEQALKREIVEELGIVIDVHQEYFSTRHAYSVKTVDLHFFDCSIMKGEPRAIQVADFHWVRPTELVNFEFPEADRELIKRLHASA